MSYFTLLKIWDGTNVAAVKAASTAAVAADPALVVAVSPNNTIPIKGSLTDNNAAPSTNNLGVLPAVASFKPLGVTQGNLVALQTNLQSSLRVRVDETDTTGNVLTATRFNQLELNFSIAFASLPVTNTLSTGTATQANGCATYSTTSAGTAEANGVSTQALEYRPGHEWYAEFTAAFTTPTDGTNANYQHIGPYNSTDGFYIGYDEKTFNFTQLNAGAPTAVAKASWNGDPLDGSTNSQFTSGGTPVKIDFTTLNIWRIRGTWFGVGPVVLEVLAPDDIWVRCHTLRFPNTIATPYTTTTNYNMQVDVKKTGSDGTVLSVNTACWALGTNDQTLTVSDTVTDNSLSIFTRSIIAGKSPSGTYKNVGLSADTALLIAGSGNHTTGAYTFDPTHTATQTIVNALDTYTTWTVQMVGTGTTISAGQLTFEGSVDGTDWIALWPFDVGNNGPLAVAYYTAAKTSVIYQMNVAGLPFLRVLNNVTVAGTGSPQVVFSYSLEALSTPSSVAITASNIHVSSAQGTAASVSGAWPTIPSDGTNEVTVKAASTAVVTTDTAMVVAISPNAPALVRPAAPTTGLWTELAVSFSASGDNIVIPHSGTTTIRVMRMFLVNNGASGITSTALTFKDSTPTSFTGAFSLVTTGVITHKGDGEPYYVCGAGKDFIINSSQAVPIAGAIWYTQS